MNELASILSDAVRTSTAAVVLAGVACGGQPIAGPSPVAAAPPPGMMAASGLPPTFDAGAVAALGLDPDYVRRLVYVIVNDDGSETVHALERWEGGPLIMCGGDLATMAGAIERVRAANGLPASIGEDGCNVRWVAKPGVGHTATARVYNGSAILSAEILVYRNASSEADITHELGHVLGLGHSPRRGDIMYATPTAQSFSPAEAAVLRAMY